MQKLKDVARSFSTNTRTATLFPGDGIGPVSYFIYASIKYEVGMPL